MQGGPVKLADAWNWNTTNRRDPCRKWQAMATGKSPDLSRRSCDASNIGGCEVDYDYCSHNIGGSKVLSCVEKHVDDGITSGYLKSRFKRSNGVNAGYASVESAFAP